MLAGNGDASVEDGIEWLLQTVGRLGVPGLAALGVPQDRDDEIVAKAPHGQRLTPQVRLGIVLLSLGSHPMCRSPPGAEPRRAT